VLGINYSPKLPFVSSIVSCNGKFSILHFKRARRSFPWFCHLIFIY
jgi:hypothetical protein